MGLWNHCDVFFDGKRYYFLGRPDKDSGRDFYLSLTPDRVCLKEVSEVWIKIFYHGWYAVKKRNKQWEARWSP